MGSFHWPDRSVLRDNLILPALLLKNPYCKYLLKGISVGGSCCASAYVLISVVQSREIFWAWCMLVLIEEEKKCSMVGSLGKWWISTADPLKNLSSFKERGKNCEWSSREMEEQLKNASQESVGTVLRDFSCLDLIQMNQKRCETFLLTAMILLLADSFRNLLISILRRRWFLCLCGYLSKSVLGHWQCWSNSLEHGNAAAESQEEQGQLLSQGVGGWSPEGLGHRLEEEAESS